MKPITRAAVLGAGTMGAAIAAHLANAGYPVLLLDAVPPEPTAAETARGLTLQHRQVRDRLALAGLERVRQARPPALFTAEVARLIRCGNVEDDLGELVAVDWIIEAVTERLDVKRALLGRVDAVRRPGTIVSSNTSGLPISQIAEGGSADFRAHFLGTHFFNPPRQMKLLEVTPIAETLPEVVDTIRWTGEHRLGKGVVLCKDTPNFIGNRVFTFDLIYTLAYALAHGYTVEEVDRLTGTLIGRPRTATFRLLDLIGIDVMALVSQNLYPRLPHDESRALLQDPAVTRLIQTMLDRGWLGKKSGLGFYRTVRTAEGQSYWPLDLQTLEHRPPRAPVFPSLAAIEGDRDLGARLRAFTALDDRAGVLVQAVLGNLLGYASRRLPEIADDVRAVDDAMRWGFNHERGPFEIWDLLGLTAGRRLAARPGLPGGPAPWVEDMQAKGRQSFYDRPGEPRSYWSIARAQAVEPAATPDDLTIAARRAAGGVIVENESASLLDLGDDVAAFELHTKLNTLDEASLDLLQQALDRVTAGFAGLVLTGRGEHFSAGANVAMLARLVQSGDPTATESGIRRFQHGLQAVHFSARPVVAAPQGYTLGGGCELMLAASQVVAAAETYAGLVEVGVGWLPVGGGCKELIRRLVSPVAATGPTADPLPALERAFDLIAQARVSTSAAEARDWGLLAPTDVIIMRPEDQLAAAKRAVLALAERGYQPPSGGKTIFAAGRDALAALKIKAYLYRQGEYATDHDVAIAQRVAFVLCGGDLSEPQWVDEAYLLGLERAAALELSELPKTQERLRHFVETGERLHN
jgi:3-hydroxyacyl-CoA dehydrogenase